MQINDDFIQSSAPVNSVHINQCEWSSPRFNHTLAIARPYGWVFGIPLDNRCSVGYLYNNTINNIQDIINDINNIFKEFDLEPNGNPVSFNFNSYYRKNNFTNRLGYNGNASFFIEPLEALSTGIIDSINRNMFDLIAGNITYKTANEIYLDNVMATENVIMMHYLNQSVFDTEFWAYAKDLAIQCLGTRLKNDQHFIDMYDEIKNIKDQTYLNITQNTPEYGNWWHGSFVQNFRGMKINQIIENMLD